MGIGGGVEPFLAFTVHCNIHAGWRLWHPGLAYEGVRYFSDDGAISVLILPGTQPTTDGDRWILPIRSGITPIPLHELPGDPLVFTELYDDRTGTWFEVKEREVAVVPHVANDVVLWVDIQGQGQGGAGLRAFQ